MKTELQVIADLIATSPNYALTAEAIADTCAALLEVNPDIEASFIDEYITAENNKRGIELPYSLNYRNKLREVTNHIKSLVFAAMIERIEETGEVLIPDNGDNEGKPFFSDEIVSKYGIQAGGHAYVSEYDFASIEIMPRGNLSHLFEKNDCDMMWFKIIFNAYEDEYTLQIADIKDVKPLFRKVQIAGYGYPGLSEIEGLLKDIKQAGNSHLLKHILKYSK